MLFSNFPHEVILLCFLFGCLSGFLSGLLGIGGGFVLIPSFYFLFTQFLNIPPAAAMLYSLGTTMGCIFIAATTATKSQDKREMVLWPFFKKMSVGLVLGTLAGVFLATRIDTTMLKYAFAAYTGYIGVRMIFSLKSEPNPDNVVTPVGAHTKITLIGVCCGLVGIGGAAMIVNHFRTLSVPTRQAIATAAALQIPLAFFGVLGYMIFGNSYHAAAGSPQWLGNFSLPVFLFTALGISLTTSIGVMASHRLPVSSLKRIFGVVCLIIGFHMAGLSPVGYVINHFIINQA